MAEDIVWIRGLIGGALIGASASVLMLFNGRVSGISGIVGAVVAPRGDVVWRLCFLLGLVAAGWLSGAVAPTVVGAPVHASWLLMALAGGLVGAGTRIGGGCTSGHGVCGLARGSGRSLVATLTFMLTGAATVAALRLIGGLS